MTDREQLTELANKLFIYTDSRNWAGLQNEVFNPMVFLDMTSLGGSAAELSAQTICEMWAEGFKDLDAVNHLGGNYLIETANNEANIFAYATATHYKESAQHGKTREFVGTYDLKAKRVKKGWRIYSFVYHLKYLSGNVDLS